MQLVWVPGRGIDGSKTADHLAKQASPLPLTAPEPVLGISAKVTRGVTGAGQVGNTRILAAYSRTKAGKGLSLNTLC